MFMRTEKHVREDEHLVASVFGRVERASSAMMMREKRVQLAKTRARDQQRQRKQMRARV